MKNLIFNKKKHRLQQIVPYIENKGVFQNLFFTHFTFFIRYNRICDRLKNKK